MRYWHLAFFFSVFSGSTYIIGRPLTETETIVANSHTMTKNKKYSYNTAHLVSNIESSAIGTSKINEDYTYDVNGNVIKKTVTTQVPADSRSISYEYDTSGRFLTKVKDNDLLESKLTYYSDGTLKTKIDPLSSTSYTYDSWGKKLTVKDELLDKAITYTYSRSAEKTIFTTTTDVLDGSASEETYDDLGRKIRSGEKTISGSFAYTSYLYDILDRVYKISEPYFGTVPSEWNETKFDIYSRPVENKLFNSRTITTDYTPNSLITKITDGLKTSTFSNNIQGTVASTDETIGGKIDYSYYANGGLKKTSYNGIAIDIEQDGWGRKTKLKDPAAGDFTYTYNDFGELTEETAQNGNVKTSFTRDSSGRITNKTIFGGGSNTETTYAYDSSKLPITITYSDKNESVGSKIITTITYDTTYKRPTTIVEDKTGISKFTTVFDYDGLGRVIKETKKAELGLKSSIVITKNNYQYGNLYQILDENDKVLWQANTFNAKGELLENIIGNGIKITNSYDTDGYLSKVQHDKTTTPTGNIVTLTTAFDKNTDNLDSRINSLFNNYTESFDYDDLNRLTKYTNKYGILETQTYDTSGKITSNGLGTYTYDTTKKYQNTSITPTPEAVGYYANRQGIFNDSMEDRTGWGLQKYPNTSFFSYDNVKAGHSVGKNTLKLANTSTTEQYVFADKWVSIDNKIATSYTYSAWVFSDGPQSEIFLYMKDAANAVTQTNTVNNVTGIWKKVVGTFSVPASVKKLSLRLDNNSQGNVWFDDIEIRKTSDPASSDRSLNISYNAFKAPLHIEETNVDKVSFTYNDDNNRSTMYYGGFDIDKTARPLRKHYSSDGSMEIKENTVNGTVEFLTYVGGGGYTAPMVVKTDGGTNKNFLYLHRDFQGSILAITNASGILVEKRLFDAWGNIIKVQDGSGSSLNSLTILDRGYTGHEHLQSLGLINMNARLYDPMLHRFLQTDNYIQDPTNTQNYNQYGYVFNNPLLNTDPSGNICDCPGGGFSGPGVDGGGGTGISTDLRQLGKDFGIDRWMRKNLNFRNWSLRNIFGGGGDKNPPPPPNMSRYTSIGSQLANSPYSSIPTRNISTGTIQLPPQHRLLGINMTALSEGNLLQQTIYGAANSLNIPVQYLLGRDIGNSTMRNLDGSSTSIDEATLAFGTLPLWFVGGGEVSGVKNAVATGGKNFAQYRAAYWAGKTKPVLKPLQNEVTGQVWNQFMELHHRFIPQRWKWAPNWLKNNRFNLQELDSLKHAQLDPYRARFAPQWVKDLYNLTWK
jgi:RHS repeat-associated protein